MLQGNPPPPFPSPSSTASSEAVFDLALMRFLSRRQPRLVTVLGSNQVVAEEKERKRERRGEREEEREEGLGGRKNAKTDGATKKLDYPRVLFHPLDDDAAVVSSRGRFA